MKTLLTLAEAAPLCGLSPAALRIYASRGTLHAQMIGKTWVVTEADLQRFAALPRTIQLDPKS